MESRFSVRELNARVRRLLESDEILKDVWVEAEISGFKRAEPSGHCYFTLKDGKSQISAVMWRSSAQTLAALPKDGDAVLIHGYVGIYEERGTYQLYVDRIRPLGIGDLYRQFELLKQTLAAEGLFDEERKRPLPAFPRRIGVVTSPSAAAFQDVLNVLRRRFPLAEVVLSPTLVQGLDAPAQIVRAFERLYRRDDLDVILVCRGGGSIEDLWAFNDEAVARAIVASRVPVVSGVGHETDFTIADFAADLRAPTPSAAAELLTPDIDEIRFGLDRMDQNLAAAYSDALYRRQQALAESTRALRSFSPQARIRNFRQRLDDWSIRSEGTQRGRLALLRTRVEAREQALVAANPQAILERGYALITDAATGARIKSADAARGRIAVQFHDGAVEAEITTQE